jgi:hypothetical protein
MDKNSIEKVNKQVSKKFPETVGLKPSVRKQPMSKKVEASRTSDHSSYLLTYRFKGVGPSGQKIPRLVRVVATPSGRILKISTSK